MSAYNYLDTMILGLMQGIEGVTDFIETLECGETNGISYGNPLFSFPGNTALAYNAHQDTAVITTSGAFTSNDTAVIVTLNGVALAGQAWATNDAALGALVVAVILAALPTGSTCVYAASAHTFTIKTAGADLTATLASSGGVTATTAYSSSCLFMGIAGFTQKSLRTTAGGYTLSDAMNNAYLGFIPVYTAVAVTDGQTAYVIIAPGATQGQFTNVAGSGPANFPTKAIFRGTTTGAGIVLIELRGKQNYAGTL